MLRVDNIPWYLKPFFLIWGYALGWMLYGWTLMVRLTCKIKFEGFPSSSANVPLIYCIWHKDLALYFGVFNRVSKQAWLNHPAWYMKPIHVLLHLTGVEHICLGSSGNDGKLALQRVIKYLKEGYSTLVATDGPAGPVQQLKPGVLWMSRDAHIPVVPIKFICNRGIRLGGWDKKFVPGLFSEITVIAGQPVQVTETNIDASQKIIEQFLND